MEKGSGIGVVLLIIGVFLGSLMKGVSPVSLVAVPAAILIVLVGSLGAGMISYTFEDTAKIPKLMKMAIAPGQRDNPAGVVDTILTFADKARREGLLALEEDANKIEEPFLRRGLQMAIDGADPETVRETLESEVHSMKERHKVGSKYMTDLGIYAPTYGIIGAVIGLIATLANMDDPEKLGGGIAAAFVATFWGVFLANGVFLPFGKKLARLSQEEVAYNELIIEGILSIQAGSSPRVVGDLLRSHLPPALRRDPDEERKSA